MPVIQEETGRPVVLVIEDNPDFLRNAVAGIKERCTVVIAQTLEEAKEAMKDGKVKIVLSDVHFPVSKGGQPEANVSAILELAWKNDVTVCFVTRADHHGLIERGDEGFVSLKVLELGDIAATKMEVSRKERCGEPVREEARLFGLLRSDSARVFAEGKSPDIWREALDMAMNAGAKAGSLAFSIRAVRRLGLDADIAAQVPRVFVRKQ